MKYNMLGNSGRSVPEIALVAMITGEDSQRSTPPDIFPYRFLQEYGDREP